MGISKIINGPFSWFTARLEHWRKYKSWKFHSMVPGKEKLL